MQRILSLQQDLADAHLAAGQWRSAYQTAQSRYDSAEARRIEMDRQLQSKQNEMENLLLLSTQQAEVSMVSQSQNSCCCGLASRVQQRKQSYVVKAHAMAFMCISCLCITVLQVTIL